MSPEALVPNPLVNRVDEILEAPIFAARLVPHRSLDRFQFRVLLILFAGVNFAASLPFIVIGAWPVAGFCGLDVALLFFAFRANFIAARAYEQFSLTPLELSLAKVSATGRRAEWRFNPSWVRLDREEHEEFGTMRLALVSRGCSVEIAKFLGPAEKAQFASRLTRALAEARRGARFS
jgi:uncharacterized membrane protein